ncbi:hypothetical protein KF840_03265 [bacterium]|nr:hypothetical protein [bacterium]
MRLSPITVICLALLWAPLAAAAGAGDAGAACAAGLAKDPRAIYDASVGAVQPSTDLKALLTDTTRGLVRAGTVARAGARDSARAAYQCLELVQRAE